MDVLCRLCAHAGAQLRFGSIPAAKSRAGAISPRLSAVKRGRAHVLELLTSSIVAGGATWKVHGRSG